MRGSEEIYCQGTDNKVFRSSAVQSIVEYFYYAAAQSGRA